MITDATLRSVASSNGRNNGARGSPVVALNWQFVPPWASPINAGLRRSVG
jgi:hypothetical protein